MKYAIFKTRLTEIISALLIFLFVYAATSKLLDYQKFQVQLGQSPLLTSFAGWIAWLVPPIEIIVSLLLLFSKTRLLGLYASLTLMVMFSSYVVAITRFSDYIPCSCGGVLTKMNWNQHLVFNIIFVLITLTGILIHSNKMEKEISPLEIN